MLERREMYRLSPWQEALWELQAEGPELTSQCALLLEGALDSGRLRGALQALVDRHEILRTTFYRIPGSPAPLQVVAEEEIPLWDELNLGHLPRAAADEEIAARFAAETDRCFAAGVSLRALLLRLAPERHALLLTLPALCADAESLRNMYREIAGLYAGEDIGGPSEEPVQYLQFSEWHHQFLAGEGEPGVRQLRPAGELASPVLPWETEPELEERLAHPEVLTESFPEEAGARIDRLPVTPEAFFLACWQVLLWRLIGLEAFAVGAVVNGRKHEELETALGLYARRMQVPARLEGDLALREVMLQAQASLEQARERVELPAPSAAKRIGFAFEERLPIRSNGLAISVLRQSVRLGRPRVELCCVREGRSYSFEIHFDPARLRRPDALRLAAAFRTVAQSALRDPGAVLAEIGVLDPAEARRLHGELAGPRLEVPGDCLHELVAAQAARAPERDAIVFPGERISYAGLESRANRLARHLRSLGVGPESLVALCLERSPEMIVAILAVWKAGGAYVPLDPSYPAERLAFQLADARPRVLVTRRELAGRLAGHPSATVLLDEDAAEISRRSDRPLSVETGPENLAYVIYTSGSTGRPKGTLIEHRAASSFALAMQRAVLGDGAGPWRLSVNASFAFDASVQHLVQLTAGHTLCLVPEAARRDARRLAAFLAESGVEGFDCTPSQLGLVLAAEEEALGGLRFVVAGGEAIPPVLWARLAAHPRVRFFNVYGPTECTINSTARPVDGDRPTLGRPLANTRLAVLDRWSLPVPPGVAGELYIAGTGLARGYLDRPDLTAERFVPDPFAEETGARIYRTGDLVRVLDAGELEFLGRVDGQVKIRGFRIEPGEIEAVLAGHPALEAAAVAVREESSGQSSLAAFFVLRPGRFAAAAELRAWLEARLPAYMVPAWLIELPALPLSAGGKLDRRALAAIESGRQGDEEPWEAPGTPVEEILAGLWSEVLGSERVGRRSDFFLLGGHSLLAAQLMHRVERAFQVELPLAELFERPTLSALAERVEQALRPGTALPPIERAPRGGKLPLSFGQRRLWLLDRLEPGSAAYNIPLAVRFTGRLDPAALASGLAGIVRRHEALRTAFPEVGGEPVQRILPPTPVPLPQLDLSALPEAVARREASRKVEAAARRPFDLGSGELLRALLLRLGAREHVAVLNLHHIASDGWSMGILLQELARLYGAFTTGAPPDLPELPIQYADFAAWQQRWLSGERLAAQLAAWKEMLAGAPALLRLPTDRPRRPVAAPPAALLQVELPAALVGALRDLARQEGATLFMALLAGFHALLSRLGGQEDVCVGSPVAGRSRFETAGLIGFFVNTLVLRADLSGEPGFREILRRERRSLLAAFAHQDLPFDRLVEELRPERTLTHTPLFQAVLALQNAPREKFALPDLEIEELPPGDRVAKFDLTLALEEEGEGLAGSLEYRTDLFDPTTATRLAEGFVFLLRGLVAAPDRAAALAPLLTAPARHQVLAEWNDTASALPRGACIPDLFAEQVERAPEAIAVSWAEGMLTYRELNQRANGLARFLRRRGVGPEVPVTLCVERSPEMVMAILAILKAGGAYIPLDPSHPAERLALLRAATGAALFVTQERIAARLPAEVLAGCEVVLLDTAASALVPALDPPRTLAPYNLAYVMYTSGSTGEPKGVAVTHRGVIRLVRATGFARLAPDEVFAQLAPIAFDASTLEIWGSLLNCGRLALMPPGALSLEELGRELACQGVTSLWLTAGLFHQMAERNLAGLAGLRQLLAGGDVLSPAAVRRVREHLPGCRLINGYGPTENTTFTCCATLEDDGAGSSVPIGSPIANTRILVLDRLFQPVPIGVEGELYTGGEGLARGYLGRPDLTAERFVPSPFPAAPGERLYRTGDLVRQQADGTVQFLGRADAQVKIRGFRVEPGEIEAALVRHPLVADALVVAREDVPGDKRLAAYCVPAGPREPAVEELREYLRTCLPEPMIPAAFVLLPAFPLTANGKPDRRALPAPETARSPRGGSSPATAVERIVAGIWEEVLGGGGIDLDDDFFELGGHSLAATRVLSQVRERLQVEVPLRCLFEEPTVRGLVLAVEAARRVETADEPPIPRAPRDRDLPLSFAQERLWFVESLRPGGAENHIPNALRLRGNLDAGLLERTLTEILRRHESLRTRIVLTGGSPAQAIDPPSAWRVPVIDLAALPALRREEEARRLALEAARRPFDLAAGPLWRSWLVRRAGRDQMLLFTMHHIVSDGWSMALLIREVGALYRSFAQGAPTPRRELPIQYADFAVWQRNRLRGEEFERHLDFWRRHFGDSPEMLELPIDGSRSTQPDTRGAVVSRSLPVPLSARLRRLARSEGSTLHMVLLSAFDLLLHRLSGQSPVVVGMPIANRNRAEVEELIGLFVNVLALAVDFSGRPTFRELLGRVRAVSLEAYAHQDLPFEKLVAELHPERSLTRHPLFEVMFNNVNLGEDRLDLPGLRAERWQPEEVESRLPMTLYVDELSEQIGFQLVYQRSLFSSGRMEVLLDQLAALLEQAAEDPEILIEQMSLVSPGVRDRLPDPRLALDEPVHAPVTTELVAWAERAPERPAVVQGGRWWSYSELSASSEAVAGALLDAGLRRGEVVAIRGPRSFGLIAAVVGTLRSAGVFFLVDESLPEARQQLGIRQSGACLLLRVGGGAMQDGSSSLREIAVDADSGRPAGEAAAGALPEIGPGDPAYIFFTSGSTGLPKGILGVHKGLSHFIRWQRETFGVRPEDRLAQTTALTFDPFLRDVFTPLTAGASLHLPEEPEDLLPERILPWLEREGISLLHVVPRLAQMWLAAAPERPSLRRLRWVFFAGEQLTDSLVRQWRAAFPMAGGIVNLYGPSETTMSKCWMVIPNEPRPGGQPVGRPMPQTQALVLSPIGRLCGPGEPGEVFLRTPFRTLGYLDAELTRERFVPNPFRGEDPSDLLYRTGDVGRYRPDGLLEVLGRMDHQVKIRGVRIEPEEVAAVLAAHPGVGSCVVVARPGDDGEPRLVAYLVAAASGLTAAGLRAHLAALLPPAMVPAAFVVLDRLPALPNGKVDRRSLPEPAASEAEARYRAPSTPVEELLVAMWSEVLDREGIGAGDDFFELGGHSLLAARLAARLRAALGVDLPLRALFENPTIEQLAQRIEVLRREERGTRMPELDRAPRTGPAPLSFAQERLWFLDQLEPGTSTFNIPAAVRLRGRLDPASLAGSLEEVMRRHEILRTTFGSFEGRPHQTVAPGPRAALPLSDLSALPEPQRRIEVERWSLVEARSPFDLARGPLLRARLLRLTADEHVFLVNTHHIVSDAWSLGNLVRELGALYPACAEGRPSPLPELPLQYADYAAWQRRWLSGQALDEQIAYWRLRLGDASELPALDLPLDRLRPPVQTYRGASFAQSLASDLADPLRALGRREGTTLFMTLLAAFQVLLHRLGGQDQVLVGSPIAGRHHRHLESLIGVFLNTLVLAADFAGKPGFRAFLAQVRRTALEAYDHQDLPFEKLLEELKPERDLSRTPLFQVFFNMLNVPVERIELSGLELTPLVRQDVGSKFDLTLYARDNGDQGIGLTWVYNADLFDPARIEEMARQLDGLLRQVTERPDAEVTELSLITAAARGVLPDPAEPLDERWHGAVHELFAEQARLAPDRLAVIDPEESWTRGELDRQAGRLAARLVESGLRRGDVVAVWAQRSAPLVWAMLGVLKAGGAFVILDPAYPAARSIACLEIAEPRAWLRIAAAAEPHAEISAWLDARDLWCRLDLGSRAVGSDPLGDASPPRIPIGPDDLAYVAFTSGSTGRPKGVLGRHGPLSHFLPWLRERFDLGAEDRFSMLSGLSHDPLQRDILQSLPLGATICIPDPDRMGTPGWLAAWMRDAGVTVAHLTPAMVQLLGVPSEDGTRARMPSLRRSFVVGDVLTWEDVDRLRELAPGVLCINYYGSTETQRAVGHHLVPERRPAKSVLPLGRGIVGVQLLVMSRADRQAGIGEAGEVSLRSAHLARGYLHDPELTAARFTVNPFTGRPEDRLYRTGDLGRYLPDGEVEFLGRADQQVKIRGFRIELGEIQAALARHPAVADLVVLLRQDPGREKYLAAYVVPAVGLEVTPAELRALAGAILPDYMVPSAFVLLPWLPMTPNGKLDRRALPEPERVAAEWQPPCTVIELTLAEIWREVLGIERIGRADDFFALGGHSLRATQVVSRVIRAFSVDLPVRALFEAPTLAKLAKRIQTALATSGGSAAPPLVPVARGDFLPLSFAQQRLWFLEQIDPGNPAYHISAALQVSGESDLVATLERSFDEILRRHEALRTRFGLHRAEPVQEVAAASRFRLPVLDLRAVHTARRETEWMRLSALETRQPFDLGSGPFLRSVLLRLEHLEHVLVVTLHHIASDGWSLGILIREVGELYRGLVTGEPAALAELPIQYVDYAVWQRAWLQGEALAVRLAYWKKRLAGAPAVLELPTDRSRPPVRRHRGGRRSRLVSEPLASAVRALGRREGATLFMVLLAAFQALLSRLARQDDISVGTSIAGRNRLELEPLIGFFVNTLVLRTDLSGAPGFRELLGRVRQTSLEADLHQELPFERLVEEMQPDRNVSHSPLFQVMFTIQNLPTQALELPGLTLTPIPKEEGSAKFDLELQVSEMTEGLAVLAEFDADLFDRTTVQRLLEHFDRMLAAAVREPDLPVSDLTVLGYAERHQIVLEWSDSAREVPVAESFQRQFTRRVAIAPDAVAAVCEDVWLTYRELDRRSQSAAARLAGHGVRCGTVVALFMERGLDFLTAVLAVFQAGAAYLPLDPHQPIQRLATVLANSKAVLTLTAGRFSLTLARAREEFLSGAHPPVAVLEEILAPGDVAPHPVSARGGDLAYVIYTSGSTGTPKGAMVEQRGMVNHLYAKVLELELTADDRVAQNAGQTFDISVWQLLAALVVGGCVEIYRDEVAHDPACLINRVERDRVTVLEVVPSLLRFQLDEIEQRRAGRPSLEQLRGLIPTGEALPPELCRRWLELYPNVPLLNAYGPTECSDDVTHHRVRTAPPVAQARIPIGRPVVNLRLWVLDRNLQPVPIGVGGELCVGGIGVGRGYLGDGGRTAEVFVPDPLSDAPGARLYRTGDLARFLANGEIDFLGRIDHQVKVRGFRIELGEIEAALGAHSEVREAVVLAPQDQSGSARLVAYVVHEPGSAAASLEREPEEPSRFGERVAQWQMIFDDVYGQRNISSQDSSVHLRVWVSSYTAQPFQEQEIFESVEDSVQRILGLRPRRVLEIGCGSGLLVTRIAPLCERYVGTDLSGVVLEALALRLEGEPWRNVVELRQQPADDLEGLLQGEMDVVVVNEVVQYFPDVSYLIRVLERVAGLVRPGGFLFLGGLRSLPLLKAFHVSVQLYQGAAGLSTVGELRRRIETSFSRDKELALDPEFFPALRQVLPSISRLWIRPKGGRFRNEFTKFRYDAILEINGLEAKHELKWSHWVAQGWTLRTLRDRLAKAPEILPIAGFPNARVADDVQAVKLLARSEASSSLADLRIALRDLVSADGIDPEDLREEARNAGYQVEISWLNTDADGQYDAIFFRRETEGDFVSVPRRQPLTSRTWDSYGNFRSGERSAADLVPRLKEYLARLLPDYMVPSLFVVLEALPLTLNGKIDRRALSEPGLLEATADAMLAPRTHTEEVLAQLWAGLLRCERVGARAHFFDLGGHSLLATRLISRIREAFEVEIPLRAVFDFPLLTDLARRIDEERGEGAMPLMPRIERIPREGELPLSFAQQRLWFLDQLDPGNVAYNMLVPVRLSGRLDEGALERSLSEIVRRHEALRTVFPENQGRPRQVVLPAEFLPLHRIDLSGIPEAFRDSELRRLVAAAARLPFDLSRGPLIRIRLLRLAATESVLVCSTHHIVSDGWSLGLLVREVAALYPELSQGRPSPLPELPLQYVDFAGWQRRWLAGDVLESHLVFWREYLAEAPAQLILPTDRSRPAMQTYRGSRRPVVLAPELSQALRRLGRQHGATSFMVLLAAFHALLSRYSGQLDISVGTPVAGRHHLNVEELIGLFLNTIVVRTDLSGDPMFSDLLARVRRASLDVHLHQDLPFEKLVDEIGRERSLSYSPLFQVMFILQNTPFEAAELPDLMVTPLITEGSTAKFDLTLSIDDATESFAGSLEYNTDLFDATTAIRLTQHFGLLVAGAAEDPGRRLADLPLLLAAEGHQAIVGWNDSRAVNRLDRTVVQLFDEQVLKAPGSVAALFAGSRLTYGNLDARASRLARRLRVLGVGPEVIVGLLLERSLDLVVALLGVLKAGGAYLPLDPAFPRERLAFMLEDSGAPVLLTQRNLVNYLAAESVATVLLDGEEEPLEEDVLTGPAVRPENLAYVLYTSGSTGRPKGVQVPHGAFVNFLDSMGRRPGLSPDDVLLSVTTLSFDIAGLEIFLPLINGATVALASRETAADPHLLAQELCATGATAMQATPATWRLLLDGGWDGSPGLKALCGGEALPRELADRLVARCQSLWNVYGPTETTVWSTVREVHAEVRPGAVPLGRPIDNTGLYVLDPNLRPVPLGVGGELYIGGTGVTRGYLNRPDLTADRFRPQSFSAATGERMYATGDLVRRLPDGDLEFLGRIDQQVKVRGFRIELGEVEAGLSLHPAVREAAVLVREDVPGQRRLVGYVTVGEPAPSVAELRAFLAERLPEYMVPAAVVFLPAMPRTPNGKLDRRQLPVPEAAGREVRSSRLPRTPVEQSLAAIWHEVLRCEEIGIEDNFFELGGDSILSIQVVSRAGLAGLRITPRQVFEHPTIFSLARAASSRLAFGADQGLVTGPVPLTPAQHALLEEEPLEPWYADRSVLLAAREPLDFAALVAAVARVLAQHDALRLRFRWGSAGWEQNGEGLAARSASEIDLSALPAWRGASAIEEMAGLVRAGHDLERGPALRVVLFRRAVGGEDRLLLATHSLVVDGASWRILLEDLREGYEAFALRKIPAPRLKTTSFRSWAELLVERARSGAQKDERGLWLDAAHGRVFALPADRPGGANRAASARTVTAWLEPGESLELTKELPLSLRARTEEVLLAALAEAVAGWTGSRRVKIELETLGREEIVEGVDLARTVGRLTAAFPLLIDLDEAFGPADAVAAVKRQLRLVPDEGLGYGLLRFLSGDAEVMERLRSQQRPEILFEYLGETGESVPETAPLFQAPEPSGLLRSPRQKRRHVLEVHAGLRDGRLFWRLTFSESLHDRSTIERLAERCSEALRSIAARSPEAPDGDLLASDFALTSLSQAHLQAILGQVGQAKD